MGLKLQTSGKKAEVHFSDQTRLIGSFFVSLHAQSHAGSEYVIDRLNGERSYLPFESEEGEIVLIQKRSIEMVVLDKRELNKNLGYQQEIAARVNLLSGQNIKGKVYPDLPKEHSRLSDFVNLSEEFFHLEVCGKDYLINSLFVKMVRHDLSK